MFCPSGTCPPREPSLKIGFGSKREHRRGGGRKVINWRREGDNQDSSQCVISSLSSEKNKAHDPVNEPGPGRKSGRVNKSKKKKKVCNKAQNGKPELVARSTLTRDKLPARRLYRCKLAKINGD